MQYNHKKKKAASAQKVYNSRLNPQNVTLTLCQNNTNLA